MAAERNATIRHVASAAGVSIQTVSRVLNEHPNVAKETRQRVLDAIRELHYRPDSIARSLSRRRSYSIGVVVAEIGYHGPNRMLAGIEQQAAALGYSLLLCTVRSHTDDYGAEQLEHLLSHKVDGIIWSVPQIDDNYHWLKHKVDQVGMPVICTSTGMGGAMPVVVNDNRSGGRMATEHLLKQGYQQIGLLNGPHTWSAARDRWHGWRDALTVVGRPSEPRQTVQADWSSQGGELAFTELLKQFPEMDAVFVGNDQMALGALQAASRLGRRVPEDLGVIGYDAMPESAYFWPPLSSVRQHLHEVGGIAVRELSHRIELAQNHEPAPPTTNIVLMPELVVRASSQRKG